MSGRRMTALGTRRQLASVVPVADEATRPFMQAVNHRIVAGAADALAMTSAETRLNGFVCVGRVDAPDDGRSSASATWPTPLSSAREN